MFAHLRGKESLDPGLAFGRNQLIYRLEMPQGVPEVTFALGKQLLEETMPWAKQLAKLSEECVQKLATVMRWTQVNPLVVVGLVSLVEVDLLERAL